MALVLESPATSRSNPQRPIWRSPHHPCPQLCPFRPDQQLPHQARKSMNEAYRWGTASQEHSTVAPVVAD
ncbi:hypothetical protein, partial [Serratia marcescens]|uniref:hypothetical protein n=1 Tax=Serratia marcescens TaxID=615 RepID=UPI001952D838